MCLFFVIIWARHQAVFSAACTSVSEIYWQHSNPAVVLIVPKDVNNRLETDEFPMFSRGLTWQGVCRDLDPYWFELRLLLLLIVVVDSHIQRIVLATEETTVTQQVSHRPIKRQSRLWSHKEVRRSTGHIMVTTRYSDQQGSKSRQKVMRLYKRWHRPISKRFIKPPYSIREQPRSTRNVVAYPRPAFSAKNRKNYAPTSFDQQVQVSQGHTFCTEIRKIEIPRSMVVEALNW